MAMVAFVGRRYTAQERAVRWKPAWVFTPAGVYRLEYLDTEWGPYFVPYSFAWGVIPFVPRNTIQSLPPLLTLKPAVVGYPLAVKSPGIARDGWVLVELYTSGEGESMNKQAIVGVPLAQRKLAEEIVRRGSQHKGLWFFAGRIYSIRPMSSGRRYNKVPVLLADTGGELGGSTVE